MLKEELNEDKAYIYDNLYLPKKYFRLAGICRSLEISLPKKKKDEEQKILKLWSMDDHHLKVPRHYIPEINYSKYKFEFIDLRPTVFPLVDIESNINLRSSNQKMAFESLKNSRGGIFNLNTGKGKTILALHKIAYKKVPALIVVHNSFLKDQWIQRIEQHLVLKDKIGIIEGNKMDWKRPITIAMIGTLANRSVANELPEGFKDWFGICFYDETHHLGAPVFSLSADVCLGERFGLSATPKRPDGFDNIVRYNIGDIFYSDMSYDLIPEIFFIETPVNLKITRWDTLFKLITRIAKDDLANLFRYKWIKKSFDEGRKIIVLSSRLEQIERLSKMFPKEETAIITGDTEYDKRLELVNKSRIIFSISRLGLEGLDDQNLDTIFFTTPIGGDVTVTENGREFLGNQIKQGMGRVLRDNGKIKRPQVYFFDDINIEPITQLNGQAKAFLKAEDFKFKVIE